MAQESGVILYISPDSFTGQLSVWSNKDTLTFDVGIDEADLDIEETYKLYLVLKGWLNYKGRIKE